MDNDIKEACKIMQEGGLILYPTDTIWGIGCDATNELAVRRKCGYPHNKRTFLTQTLRKIQKSNRLDIRQYQWSTLSP